MKKSLYILLFLLFCGLKGHASTSEKEEKLDLFSFSKGRISMRSLLSRSTLDDAKHQELQSILQGFYEGGRRKSGDGKWGYTFPINPEALDYLATLAKGKDIIEFAGASGVNCHYLLATGAKSACVIDLSQEELANCMHNSWKLGLSSQVSTLDKDLFECKFEKAKYGIGIFRNFIHFLDPQQRDQFFEILDETIEDDGLIFLTANYCRTNPKGCTYFRTRNVMIDSSDKDCLTIHKSKEIPVQDNDPELTMSCTPKIVSNQIIPFEKSAESFLSMFMGKTPALGNLDEKLFGSLEESFQEAVDKRRRETHEKYIRAFQESLNGAHGKGKDLESLASENILYHSCKINS